MGDIADDYIQRMIERGPRLPMRERNATVCKFCGSTEVRWRQQGGKWVLFSLEPGKLHQCPIADDFGVVK